MQNFWNIFLDSFEGATDLARFGVFVVIGVINTAFDAGLFWVLLRFFDTIKGKQTANSLTKFPLNLPFPAIANTISYSSAIFISFILNSIFTFAGSQKVQPSLLVFVLVSFFSLGISSLLIQIFATQKWQTNAKDLVQKIEIKLPILKKPILLFIKIFLSKPQSWALFVKLATVAITLITNYLGYRWLVF